MRCLRLPRVAARAEFRIGGRLDTVRDAARILVRCDSGSAGARRREEPRAPEGAYAAPVRVREPSPGVVGVGGVSRRVPVAVRPPMGIP